jgi:putative ABC transport system permease protein
MNFQRLTAANVSFHSRFYKLIALATLILVAVITGSLLVGESVRSTLLARVNERLGEDTETVVFARYAFFGSELASHPLFEGKAKAVLLSSGFVSDAGRLLPVMVWGVEDSLLRKGSARVNPALAAELSPAAGSRLVLRLPAAGPVPSGSLFVTDNYTAGIRLNLQGIIEPEEGGNLSMKNEQTVPCNLFMNREELAAVLEMEGKANLLLCSGRFSMADLAEAWTPALSGLRVTRREGFDEVTSDRVFLPEDAVDNICAANPGAGRLFSYLANEITLDGRSVPYSFVTALDCYRGKTLQPDELILTDYTARRLNAGLNDPVRITFFRSEDLKTLRVDTFTGRVAAILPLEELVADPTLSADFPGLTDVERCTDWNSDLPVDMELITQEDEDYWTLYRSTPKAILPYGAVAAQWSNAYGSATGIRLDTSAAVNLEGLNPSMFGLQVMYPREAGMEAARNGVDFSSLFLSLGFFIILSAVLLMLVPLSEMIYVRREEIALLSALGYPEERIVRLIRREAAPVVLFASVAGALAGLLYTRLILLLLGSLWQGATHTGGFMLFADMQTILAGTFAGFLIAWLLLRTVTGKAVKKPARHRAVSETAFLEKISLSRFKLTVAGLSANKKRAGLSFATLASGVLIVFSVGLNRRGFADHSRLLSGTGGYTLWCESAVPVYHSVGTPEGRSKLALDALPDDAQAVQLFRYGADDASCLNLNKVSQPTVLGIDMDALRHSHFRIQRSIYPDSLPVFGALQTASGNVFPALIDETALTWGLKRKLGDTLRYEAANGRQVYLQLAGTLANSVFQGNLLISQTLFSSIWSEITGSEVMLLKVSEAQTEETRQLLSQALSEYGVRVTRTSQRLKEFNSVSDTYLTIFLTLGGLGLLLGVASLAVVVRKDLASRTEQIRLYRSLGFPEKEIARILSAGNLAVPLCAVFLGVAGSLAGVSGGIAGVSLWIWLTAGALALLLILCIIVFIRQSVKTCLLSIH